MIDNREGTFPAHEVKVIQRLCDRKFGIGADGLILIEKDDKSDFHCNYFNADGSQSLCGNGSRCAVNFSRSLGIIGDKTTFRAIDGLHEAHCEGDTVHLKMADVGEPQLASEQDYFLDTGSPHHVCVVADVAKHEVVKIGREIRYSSAYENGGTNVNFVEKRGDHSAAMRTYERGVENETLSCGTGATAVALVLAGQGFESPVRLDTPGGQLEVSFQRKKEGGFENVYLIGPGLKVFDGEIEIE